MIALECEFITALLEKKITFDEIQHLKFDSNFLKVLGGTYDWITDYWREHKSLPSVELVQTRDAVFQPVNVTDNPKEIILALKEKYKGVYFEEILAKSLRHFRKTGDLDKAIAYLDVKLATLENTEEDTFEFTASDFLLGEKDYEERRKAFEEKGYYGIPTGFGPELDTFLNGGWLNGNLYGLAGETSVGKSWLVMVSLKKALEHGKRVFYLALEGTVAKEYYRFLTAVTEVYNSRLQSGDMPIDEFRWNQNQMREFASASGGAFILGTFGRRENYTPRVLENKINQLKPDIVAVDYTTLMNDGSKTDDWKAFMNVTKRQKILAVRYNIPIINVLQGTIGGRGDKMTLDNIAESKGMSRDHDEIFGIKKVDGRQYTIRLSSAKVRDSGGDFDAFYQTGWNTGRVEFLEHVIPSDF